MHAKGYIFSARGARRGSVIVVVLVTLLLASLMLVKFMESSAVELTLATRQADKERLRGDAFAALETALAVMSEIAEVDEGLRTPAQGWDDPYGYAGEAPREGVTITYAFQDESGKLSLPKISFDDMVLLAQALGLGENDARRFSDGLYTWMTPQHTPTEIEAEASRYERDTIAHEPPRRSLRSWEELRAVRVARDYVYDADGALTPFGTALHASVSLYEFSDTNANAVAPAVGTMRGWDATQTARVESYRAGKTSRAPGAPAWFRSTDELSAVLGPKTDVKDIGAEARLVRVEVTAREGQATLRLAALVALDKDVKLPAAVSADAEERKAAASRAAAGGTENTATATNEKNAGTDTKSKTGTGAGGTNTTNRGGSGGAASAEEKLNYPFVILEVSESAGLPPVAPVDEAVALSL
jgi:Type II secretion system (T2SS), protein K